jgi:hypothetical protein
MEAFMPRPPAVEALRDGHCLGYITGKTFFTNLSNPPVYTDEIGPCIASKQDPSLPHKLPPLNLALMWCCATLDTPGSTAVNPFFATKLGLYNQAGAAFTGFRGVLNGDLKQRDAYKNQPLPLNAINDPMHLHAQRVLDRLKAGDTLGESVANANAEFMPRDTTSGVAIPMAMQIIGDANARLKNVYCSTSEQPNFPNWRSSWYLVLY